MRKTKLSLFATLLAMASNENGHINFMRPRMLMEPNNGANGGGGSGGGNGGGNGAGGAGDDDLKKARAEITKLQADLAALKGNNGNNQNQNNNGGNGNNGNNQNQNQNNGGGNNEQSLLDKARNQNNQQNENKNSASEIEKSISFNLGVDNFVKDHKDLLPSEIEAILKLAHKENYDSAASKSAAIKTGMVDAFFSIEANVELLTQSQKIQLEDFKKLTKNGKEEKSAKIYENVFEPALEIIKRVKKAEELGRSNSGRATASTVDAGYKERLINGARKTHLKVKGE